MTELFQLSSPIGVLKITIKKNKLYCIERSDPPLFYASPSLSPVARDIKKQLEKYFCGRLKTFKISLYNRGTGFQKQVWAELKKIPWGKTKTYSQLAFKLKKAKAYRAVGRACANNPFLIVIPCHRVLAKKGLGGFALGLRAKQELIFLESLY